MVLALRSNNIWNRKKCKRVRFKYPRRAWLSTGIFGAGFKFSYSKAVELNLSVNSRCKRDLNPAPDDRDFPPCGNNLGSSTGVPKYFEDIAIKPCP